MPVPCDVDSRYQNTSRSRPSKPRFRGFLLYQSGSYRVSFGGTALRRLSGPKFQCAISTNGMPLALSTSIASHIWARSLSCSCGGLPCVNRLMFATKFVSASVVHCSAGPGGNSRTMLRGPSGIVRLSDSLGMMVSIEVPGHTFSGLSHSHELGRVLVGNLVAIRQCRFK